MVQKRTNVHFVQKQSEPPLWAARLIKSVLIEKDAIIPPMSSYYADTPYHYFRAVH
ncbi:hypothetical protein IX332_000053 [Porphyromonas levii]|nr:hypothetical protein [Porphyromonas levii]MBR8712217.1 hypothetical protein [Porphyromonas levii]MBR8714317.1 hypothetical protein [Porphyromonas levii]MBR8726858.1 hypothetical protein [Porphyromonas levii]MBR8728750.1 hypothetical protein [Porphyromonas levii]